MFSENSLQLMNALYQKAGQVSAHYRAYPVNPSGIEAWSKVTREYWGY